MEHSWKTVWIQYRTEEKLSIVSNFVQYDLNFSAGPGK